MVLVSGCNKMRKRKVEPFDILVICNVEGCNQTFKTNQERIDHIVRMHIPIEY